VSILNSRKPDLPLLFKGIALFSPGGDLVYCVDPIKQNRWHLHLCLRLQEILGLSETPHFLVPAYTATVDRWLDTHTQQIKTTAEVYPAAQIHQTLLSAVFATDDFVWQTAPWQEEFCNPIVLETYRYQFPQLWQSHDLIVRFHSRKQVPENEYKSSSSLQSELEILSNQESNISLSSPPTTRGYVLRLFVSGNNIATELTLGKIHQLLEQGLGHPYTLRVIDISKHPEQAETNQVSATPTLVRIWPQPVRRIVGEIDDMERVLQILTTS
jgi:circadian clock protein KaiB